jgi:hypothetical protein
VTEGARRRTVSPTHRALDLSAYQPRALSQSLRAVLDRVAARRVRLEQPEAFELPDHSDLPPVLAGMYARYGSKCPGQHWGTKETVLFAIDVAYNWWKAPLLPTLCLGDLSAASFKNTGCHKAHKSGTHVDMDLPGWLPADGDYTKEKQERCKVLCMLMIALGAGRVLFNDKDVKAEVNKWAEEEGLPGRVDDSVAGHDTHFHAEMPVS